MRRVARIFILAVVVINVSMIWSLSNLQYATALEDESSIDLSIKQDKQEEITDGETIQLEDSLDIQTEEQFTYDDGQKRILSTFISIDDELMVLEDDILETSEQSEKSEKFEERTNKQKEETTRGGIARNNEGNIREKIKSQEGLLDINNPDQSYSNRVVSITGDNRDKLERLVMGEAGGEGFEGAALVAQAIKDTMILEDEYSVVKIKDAYGYCADFSKTPNEDTIDAVRYVFDEGGYAVKHRLIYFYAPRWVKNNWSKFHESQNFIIQHEGHKFFDRTF